MVIKLKNYKYFILSLASILFFTACQDKIETKTHITNANLIKTSWDKIDGFYDDNLTLALQVFQKDCQATKNKKYLKRICKKALDVEDAQKFFTSNFTPYKLLNKKNNSQGLITGYYEPILNGSFTKSIKYKYPIYKTPKDLITVRLSSIYPSLKKYTLRGKIIGNTLVPYEARKDLKKIQKKLTPLLYVDNKIDRFFLEIQGSGKVKLPNGKIINLAYAQQNGRKYYPIGRKLIQNGYIKRKDMSLQAIRKWCENNPMKVETLFNLNNSVIFFKISSKSATGSLGIPLVAKRNLAVDTKFIPLGFLVFINTTNPTNNNKINSLMVSADTGGAIKGEVRADFFWGSGVEAKENAGKMAQKGTLTILIPNDYSKNKWLKDTSKYLKVKEHP